MKKFITVAGNIGVGKSTLIELLSKALGWEPFYEPVAQNPYLADFYGNMHAWSFHSQIFFLIHRLQIHYELSQSPNSTIQDRSIYEDAEVFARNLYLQGYFQERDYETYTALYQTLCRSLLTPDLVVYLRASSSTLTQRIAKRNRPYEKFITLEYLNQVNRLYDEWIDHFTLCPRLTIPADDLDYVSQPHHLNLILQKIQEKLSGKEEVFEPGEIETL